MHKIWNRCGVILIAATVCRLAVAQEPGIAPAPPAGPKFGSRPIRSGVPLPAGELLSVAINTTERYSVYPYKLYDAPRSLRPEVAEVELVRPLGGEIIQTLPDSFIIRTTELVGATTIVLPLVREGEEPFERRMELLVLDEVSAPYKAYLEAQIRETFPTVSVKVLVVNSQTAVLNGYVDKAELVDPIERLVRGFLAARSGTTPESITIVQAMRVTGAQQVQLRCIIAEVSRTKMRDLGFDWSWLDLGGDRLISSLQTTTIGAVPASASLFVPAMPNATPPTPFQPIVQQPVIGGANVPFFTVGNNFAFFGFLRALVENNLGKILAEPVLVTTSGQPAFFNVGGEVPVLIPQGNATISVEYRPFGTNLRFVPTVLGEGRIRLEVRPEVSERNEAFTIVVSGINVPGFATRVAETTVEMENGQTFAIAGLIQQRISSQTSKVPLMGDLPMVGWAFQNKSYRQEETELLIVVTPHLVEALNEGICKVPGRESRVPNDTEFYLGSKLEPPCFEDPYRDPWKGKHKDRPKPQAVNSFDNHGKRPTATFVPANSATMSAPIVGPQTELMPVPPTPAEVQGINAIELPSTAPPMLIPDNLPPEGFVPELPQAFVDPYSSVPVSSAGVDSFTPAPVRGATSYRDPSMQRPHAAPPRTSPKIVSVKPVGQRVDNKPRVEWKSSQSVVEPVSYQEGWKPAGVR